MTPTFLASLILTSLSGAAAFAAPGATPQCSGEIATPLLECFHGQAGVDIRLYVQEFQTCKDNQITELDRSISGLFSEDTLAANDVKNIDESDIKIAYAPTRTMVTGRVDDVTLLMPTAATLKIPGGHFEMTITTATELDHEDALPEEYHYVGSYKRFDAQGKQIDSGALNCSISE